MEPMKKRGWVVIEQRHQDLGSGAVLYSGSISRVDWVIRCSLPLLCSGDMKVQCKPWIVWNLMIHYNSDNSDDYQVMMEIEMEIEAVATCC